MSRIVFDLEADGLLDTATTVWCISTKDLDIGREFFFGPEDIPAALRYLGSADALIGHNIIGYDIPLLERLYDFKTQATLEDTLIRSRLYKSDRDNPDGYIGLQPHSLEAWGYRVGVPKVEHDDWSQYTPEMGERNRTDVRINVLVHKALNEEAKQTKARWQDAEATEYQIARHIQRQEQEGCPFDKEGAIALHQSVVTQQEGIEAEIVPILPVVPLPKSKQPKWPSKQFKADGTPTLAAIKYYGDGFTSYRTDVIVKTAPMNLKSDGQVKTYLLSIGWKPAEWNYKKGPNGKPLRDIQGQKIRTSPKITLDSLDDVQWPEGHQTAGEQIVKYLWLDHRRGMLEGFLRDLRSDGRLPAKANPIGTPTGRMIQSVVVNVPGEGKPLGHEMRSLFTCDEGYTRVGIDLVSCQLRAFAEIMKDELYTKHVLQGRPHEYTAELANLLDENGKPVKAKGKKLNFTTLFGGGPPKISSDLGISVTEAELVRKKFFANLPALPALIKRLEDEWKAHGYILGLDGRALWVRARNAVLNYRCQNFEVVVMKNFMNTLIGWSYGRGIKHKLITTMHDEAQFLVPDDDVPLFERLANDAINVVNIKYDISHCPQAIEIKKGKTWADCH